MIKTILIGAALLLVGPAWAGEPNAKEFIRDYEKGDPALKIYVKGLLDGIDVYQMNYRNRRQTVLLRARQFCPRLRPSRREHEELHR